MASRISLSSLIVNWRFCLLVVVFFIYGLFSSSTPDNPGMWEALLGVMLILVAAYGAIRASGGELLSLKPSVPVYVIVAFAWLIVVPSIIGLLIRRNDPVNFLRDVIPLIYLMIPVFFAPQIKIAPEAWKKILLWGLSFVGVVYTLRHFWDAQGQLFVTTLYGGKDIFHMDPAVLFTATFLLVYGFKLFDSGRWMCAAGSFLAGAFVYSPLLISTLRAQVVLVLVAILVVVLNRIGRFPRRISSWVPILIVLSLLTIDGLTEWIAVVVNSIIAKTTAAGLVNNRDAEFREILAHVSSRWDMFLFGDGWGSKLFLTTSGEVGYSHNIVMYLLWKTGLLGLLACSGIFCWIAKYLFFIWRLAFCKTELLALCLGCSNALIVYGGIEPGYKILTFGFVFCLILAAAYSELNAAVHFAGDCGRQRQPCYSGIQTEEGM